MAGGPSPYDAMRERALTAETRVRELEAQVRALQDALNAIYRMPCAFPDDKHESQKIIVNFGTAQRIAGHALAALPPEGADPHGR